MFLEAYVFVLIFFAIGERSEYLAKNQFVLNGNEEGYLIFIAGIYRVLNTNDKDVFFFIMAYLFLIDRLVLLAFTLSITNRLSPTRVFHYEYWKLDDWGSTILYYIYIYFSYS